MTNFQRNTRSGFVLKSFSDFRLFLGNPRAHGRASDLLKAINADTCRSWDATGCWVTRMLRRIRSLQFLCAQDFFGYPKVAHKVPSDPTILCRLSSGTQKSPVLMSFTSILRQPKAVYVNTLSQRQCKAPGNFE